MTVLYVIIGILAALILFMILRTVFTRPKSVPKKNYSAFGIDKERVVKELSEAVKIPTVTLTDNDDDGTAFLAYHKFLESTYPKITAIAEKVTINKYSLIYKIKGADESLLPIAVLAHQDVVPAPEEGWEVPPFSGEIKDGFVYGRGSQDMKSQMIAGLNALENLLENGFVPKRGIYFCFGHDEELKGTEGAREVARYLKNDGVRFEYVIDEGGAVLDGSILGIKNKIALVGTCEKGYADLELTVDKLGGHASAPTKRTAVGILSEAVYEVEINKMRPSFTAPVKDMIKALAPYMNPLYKFIFVNRDILSPVLKRLLAAVNPMTNCLVRTTLAPTQSEGASAPNVLPPRAKANINCRINIGDTAENVKSYVQKIVGKKVKVELAPGACDPSPVSKIDTDAYRVLERTINEVFDGYITAPYPFIAASDAKYYYGLSDCVYRFTPFEKTEDDANRIHAINERQDIEALVKGTEFFFRLFKNSCG